MRKRLTVPQERILGLKTSTWRDITYLLICLAITVKLGTDAATKQIQLVSPIPSAQAEGLLSPITDPLVPTNTIQQDTEWRDFTSKAKTLAPIYDYPLNVLLSQAALESDRGHSYYAVTRHNYFGIGAVDWSPDNAYSYDNSEQCIIEYMRLVRVTFPTAYADRHTPDQMIKDMENSVDGVVYATDPDYVSKIESQPEWSTN